MGKVEFRFYLSLLILPFYHLMGLFVTRMFTKHDGSDKIISKLKSLTRRIDGYGSY
jgi:hypothetical protein